MMIIYLDLDGVMVDIVSGVAKHYNMPLDQVYESWPKGVFDISKGFGVSPEKMWADIKKEGAEFWINLQPYPWANVLYDYCRSISATRFLTTPTEDPACLAGKLEWLYRFTGDRNFRDYGMMRHKSDCAQRGRVLIDDKERNCLDFEAAGGAAILFPRRWNRFYSFSENPLEYVLPQLRERIASFICEE
jgi:5'(3')-deoxyribonucleotidase